MAHLARFPVNTEDDWRERLHFVHAKASDSAKRRSDAAERFRALYDIVAPRTIELQTPIEPLTAEDFDLDWDESVVDEMVEFDPPTILHALDDARYRDFDPVSDRDLLVLRSYSENFWLTFGIWRHHCWSNRARIAMTSIDYSTIRRGLAALDATAAHTASGVNRPKVEEIFAPEQHAGALDPNVTIVLGARGTGKSFWAGSLEMRRFGGQLQTPIQIVG